MRRLPIAALALCAALGASAGRAQEPDPAADVEAALANLRSRYYDTRHKAARDLVAAGRRDPSKVGPRIMELLSDPDPRMRLQSVSILGEIRYRPALEEMAGRIALLDQADPLEQTALIEAFVKFGRDAEAQILKSGAVRHPLGRRILGRIALPGVLEYINGFFTESDNPGWFEGQFDGLKPRGKPAVYALILIVETYFMSGGDALLGAEGSKAFDMRWLALHGLGEIGDPEAVPILREVIRDLGNYFDRENFSNTETTERQAKRFAAIACWKCGDPEPLIRLIRETREQIADLKSSRGSPTVMDRIGDLHWDLALSLSPLDLVEEVVEAYEKYMYWKERAAQEDPWADSATRDVSVGQYNIACAWAKAGQPHKAMEALYKAVKMGYDNAEWAKEDGDLKSAQALPEFDLALAAIHVNRMRENASIAEFLTEGRRTALFHIGLAVDRGLTSQDWIEHGRFTPVRNEPGFHWHVARFHARAGRAEECALWLRSALERQEAAWAGLPPSERIPTIPLDDVRDSEAFLKVRDHPAVRAVLKQNAPGSRNGR